MKNWEYKSSIISVDDLDVENIFLNVYPSRICDDHSSKILVNLFVEPSTRTRVSFEIAAKQLGMDVINMNAQESSIAKYESLSDTLMTLDAMGVNIIVLRQGMKIEHPLLNNVKAYVINAGDGINEHPTQALLDLYTIWKSHDIKDLKVTILGDSAYSRVAHSNIKLLSRYGAKICLCGSPELVAYKWSQDTVTYSYDIREGCEGADVIMVLRPQTERHQIDIDEYAKTWQLLPEHVGKDTMIMHPGPMWPGYDISPKLAYGAQSLIQQQVINGVQVRKFLLDWILTE